MAGSRETRCISAAFDFLNTADFCQRCMPGSQDHGLDSDSDHTDSSCDLVGVKKSESDTVLLQHLDDSEGREERRVVCLCQDREGSCDQHHGFGGPRGSDFLQGYIDRYASGKTENTLNGSADLNGGETDTCVLRKNDTKDNCVKTDKDISNCFTEGIKREANTCGMGTRDGEDVNSCPPLQETGMTGNLNLQTGPGEPLPHVSHPRLALNGTRQGQIIISGSETNGNTLHKGAGQSFDLESSKSETVCKNHMVTNDGSSSTNTDRVLRKGEVCKGSDNKSCTGEGASCETAVSNEENEEEEVVMRPNRHLINRRSTDTGLISTAFGFLPTTDTDSVFLPPETSSPGKTGMSMPSVKESEPHHCDHNRMVECSASEGEGDCGRNPIMNSRDAAREEGGTRKDVSGCSGHDRNGEDKDSVKDDMECMSEDGGAAVRLRRHHFSKQDSITEEEGSGDSSDDDAGVYAESFRRSNWIRIDDDGQLELAFPAVNQSRLSSASKSSAASKSSGNSRSSSCSADMTDGGPTASPKVTGDESPPILNKSPSPRLYLCHKRSDSTSTTLSEREFKKEYVARRKCLIQRQNSSKEYHRFSANVYEAEKSVRLEKGPGEQDFGLHILDSQPAYITRVDPGSAADRVGVEEGQILVSVNGTNVLSSSHKDIVALIINSPSVIDIAIATSDFQPSRDLQVALMEGHMQKLGGTSSVLMRRWKRRYFILRQDSCLYYYKQKEDSDPLGAIPLAGYTFSRHLDSGRDYCFKAEKYGARTYYFMTESRDIMTKWVGALSDAAARSKNRKESFVSVSSHNVGLPALDIRRPECTGYMMKVGNRRKTWHRRYCVLKDACLYYYKNVNSLSALGVAHLHGYKVDPSLANSKRHAFALLPPANSMRTFQFSAENDTDRQRWVQAMIRSIQRWVQIDNDC